MQSVPERGTWNVQECLKGGKEIRGGGAMGADHLRIHGRGEDFGLTLR